MRYEDPKMEIIILDEKNLVATESGPLSNGGSYNQDTNEFEQTP